MIYIEIAKLILAIAEFISCKLGNHECGCMIEDHCNCCHKCKRKPPVLEGMNNRLCWEDYKEIKHFRLLQKQKQILDSMANYPLYTLEELAVMAGLSVDDVRYCINDGRMGLFRTINKDGCPITNGYFYSKTER